MTRRIKSTDRLPRLYGANDPRLGKVSRIGAVRQRATEEAAEAALEAAEEAAAAVADVFEMSDLVGASFPPAPVDGQPFVRSDLDEMFTWDDGRGKWLSVRTFERSFTNQTTVAVGGALRIYQGPNTSTTNGPNLQHDCTLVGFEALRVTTGAGDSRFDLQAGANVRYQHTVLSAATTSNATNLDVDFTAGEILNCVAGQAITGGGYCTATFRRRAT